MKNKEIIKRTVNMVFDNMIIDTIEVNAYLTNNNKPQQLNYSSCEDVWIHYYENSPFGQKINGRHIIGYSIYLRLAKGQCVPTQQSVRAVVAFPEIFDHLVLYDETEKVYKYSYGDYLTEDDVIKRSLFNKSIEFKMIKTINKKINFTFEGKVIQTYVTEAKKFENEYGQVKIISPNGICISDSEKKNLGQTMHGYPIIEYYFELNIPRDKEILSDDGNIEADVVLWVEELEHKEVFYNSGCCAFFYLDEEFDLLEDLIDAHTVN